MLGVQCMRLWCIILVQNIAPKLTERCSCTDFSYSFVQMNWRVYNSAMVAYRVRLMFCEHKMYAHTHYKNCLFYRVSIQFRSNSIFCHRNRSSLNEIQCIQCAIFCMRKMSSPEFLAMPHREFINIFAIFIQPWAHN